MMCIHDWVVDDLLSVKMFGTLVGDDDIHDI